MNDQTIAIIISLLGSQLVVGTAQSYFNRKKNSVETDNIRITGEVTMGEFRMKYYQKVEDDLLKLSNKFEQLSEKFDVLKVEKDTLARETLAKDKKIIELEDRIDTLEKEIEKYKDIADSMKNVKIY